MKCQHCQRKVVLPFNCQYCGGQFCSEHRLPENHSCPEYSKVMAPREEAPPIVAEMPERRPYEYPTTHAQSSPTSRIFWFSPRELKHLAIGSLLVMGVGLSMFFVGDYSQPIPIGLAFVLTLSFFLRELAHKLTAQHYGLWAEFRLTLSGALVTPISMFLPLFKIISPGAVMIAGHATKDSVGKTALAGSLVNIALSVLFIGVASSVPNLLPSTVYPIAAFGAWINAFIAIFNLIPLGMMDGLKVLWWDKLVWLGAFTVSLLLGIFIYVVFSFVFML